MFKPSREPIQALHVLAQLRLHAVHPGVESRFEAQFHLLYVLARNAVEVRSKLRDSFSWLGWVRTCHRSADSGSSGLDNYSAGGYRLADSEDRDLLIEGPLQVAFRVLFSLYSGILGGVYFGLSSKD